MRSEELGSTATVSPVKSASMGEPRLFGGSARICEEMPMDVEEEWFGERRRERSGEDRHGSFDSVGVTRKRCDCPSCGGRSTAGLFVGTAGRIGIPATAVQYVRHDLKHQFPSARGCTHNSPEGARSIR